MSYQQGLYCFYIHEDEFSLFYICVRFVLFLFYLSLFGSWSYIESCDNGAWVHLQINLDLYFSFRRQRAQTSTLATTSASPLQNSRGRVPAQSCVSCGKKHATVYVRSYVLMQSHVSALGGLGACSWLAVMPFLLSPGLEIQHGYTLATFAPAYVDIHKLPSVHVCARNINSYPELRCTTPLARINGR